MDRNSDVQEDIFVDLGAVSVETKGGPGPRIDNVGNILGTGLSDD